jgi:hypothetical protein
MIPVVPAPEPANFDSQVRQPGLRALAEMVGTPNSPPRSGPKRKVIAATREEIPASKFPALWTVALPELLHAYGRVCAYMSFYIERVTGAASVDHMLPKSLDWRDVYEWHNYRLACALMNSRKNDYQDVLDPFDVEDGWFCIELAGYQVIPAPQLPANIEAQVQATIDRLKLNDYDCLKLREAYARDYAEGEISLDYLRRRAPFLAREIARARNQEVV